MDYRKVDCYLTRFKDEIVKDDFCYIQLTEWINGEGFDVSFNDTQNINLTHKQWNKLKELVDTYYE